MDYIQRYEADAVANAPEVPSFAVGDSLRVHVKIVEGERERVQVFEGVCIARKNRGLQSAFTVRKVSHGEGVERIFPLHSPRIARIEVMRHGRVRRAKLYYLRGLSGRRARIEERATPLRRGRASAPVAAPAAKGSAASAPVAEDAAASA